MDFFEAVERRRSIRKFSREGINGEEIQHAVRRAFQAAIWAPNSSNVQTWDFYWVRNPEKRALLVHACLSQAAARSASELVVVTANPKKWQRSVQDLVQWTEDEKAPSIVKAYYQKVVPYVYRWGLFNSFGFVKWLTVCLVGLARPIVRTQNFRKELQVVAIKSAALAAENFVLAIAAQNLDTCMMEGFDEIRVRRLLGLTRNDRVVMVIAVGKSSAKGTWGRPFRIPLERVVHEV